MQPKINDRGGKSINLISTQTNRGLHISTPLMMTWGITDFVDEKGESDNKYTISLNFPNTEYATPQTNDFLAKMKAFENQILDDAVRNSEAWFGEEMSREVAKHTFFPFLKYTKDKVTKKIDASKAPSMRAKVPNYNAKWSVEIYDTKHNLLFPCENENMTPMDFVPKKSNVACVLNCSGLWFGGKGWGLTWKLIQCVVKPHETESVYGRCHIELSPDEIDTIEKAGPVSNEEDEETVCSSAAAVSTEVADSDDEEAAPEPVKLSRQISTSVVAPIATVFESSVKASLPLVEPKVEHLVEPLVETSTHLVEESAAVVEPVVVKKKVVKKKVV
jgi:hypothetical protein